MKVIYWLGRWYGIINAYLVQLVFFKKKVYYEEGRPRKRYIKGGALIISNHYNVFDYILNMFLLLPRKLNPVSSEMPYKNKLLAFGMNFFGSIQANRITKDMSFMDKSAEVIRSGQLVQIFPEGRNTDDGSLQPFKQSYIVIAHRANCPIIPIVTDGNYGFFKRAHVIIGKEIRLSDFGIGEKMNRLERERANEYIYAKVLFLRKELERLKKKDSNKKSSR